MWCLAHLDAADGCCCVPRWWGWGVAFDQHENSIKPNYNLKARKWFAARRRKNAPGHKSSTEIYKSWSWVVKRLKLALTLLGIWLANGTICRWCCCFCCFCFCFCFCGRCLLNLPLLSSSLTSLTRWHAWTPIWQLKNQTIPIPQPQPHSPASRLLSRHRSSLDASPGMRQRSN